MDRILAVALGGALGSVVRYGFNAGATRLLGTGFPYGILLVNILGCFAMGVLTAMMLRNPTSDALRLFYTTGFLGGFTTFSAFALDTMKLVQDGQSASAFVYVLASVGLSIAAVFAGFALMKVFA